MSNPSRDTCRNGHARTPESTFIAADGSRNCRVCHANAAVRYRANRPVEETLPFGPLAEWISVHYGREPSIRNVAALCLVSNKTAHKWHRTGRLAIDDADKAAIRLGYHPVAIWPEWLDVA